VLVAVCLDRDRAASEASLHELDELARTAGVEVVESVLQLRREADPRYLIGKGKLDELNLASMQKAADVLVFDKNLSPSQARHIGDATSMKVLDRTQLILDIFAQRAQSADGKLQVELAQLKYMLPRLVQADPSLSRLMGGGVGGRGPGETKLEIDRRRVRDRITLLERRIEQLSQDRQTRRRARKPPRAAGHLDRRLHQRRKVDAAQRADRVRRAGREQAVRHARPDQPQAAVSPRARGDHHRHRGLHSRPAQGPDERVSRHARRAGRRGAAASRGRRRRPVAPRADRAVEAILHSLELSATPRLLVWNKVDQLSSAEVTALLGEHGGVAISAVKRDGLPALLEKAERTLFAETASDQLAALRDG